MVNLVLSEMELEALIVAMEQYLDWLKDKGLEDWSDLNVPGREKLRSALGHAQRAVAVGA